MAVVMMTADGALTHHEPCFKCILSCHSCHREVGVLSPSAQRERLGTERFSSSRKIIRGVGSTAGTGT